MDTTQLRYLQAINQQLGGPVRAAVTDRMTGHLVNCIHSLATRVLVDIECEQPNREALEGVLAAQVPVLRELLAGDEAGRALLAKIGQRNTESIEQLAAQLAAYLVRLGRPDTLPLAQALVTTDADNWQRVERVNAAIRERAAQRVDRETTPMTAEQQERLLALLRQECGEPEALSIKSVAAVPGGYSKQTIIVTLENNQKLPAQIVVRRDRPESPVGATVKDEFALLKLVHEAGVKAPKPWAMAAEGVMDSPIIVVSKLEGQTVGDPYNIILHHENYALDLADELAKLHAIPLAQVRPDMPGTDKSNIDLMRQEIGDMHGHWRNMGEASVTVEAAFEWLFAHMALADGPRALIHRDTRFQNILGINGEITALLDWEMAMIGHPARDLGWVYHHVVQLTGWQRFLARYEERGGFPCSPQSLAFYALWSDLSCCVYMYRARAAFNAGLDNIQYAYAGEEMRQHNVHIVAGRLRKILADGTL